MSRFRVAIIGAGFGGIASAVSLLRAGFSEFTIFEKSDGAGGTWWDNRYPGAATDAPSHLYSYSFAPHDWARTHIGHDELRRYLDHVLERFGLRPRLRLGTPVASVVWDADRRGYDLTTRSGERHLFEAVVSAVGLFSKPRWPRWPGLDQFQGDVVHTARWRGDVRLDGKRVAVVGTGSSAAQVVPALVDRVGHLTLFQRQPGWLLPKRDRAFTGAERALLRNRVLQRLYRHKLGLGQELREWNGALFRPGTSANRKAREAALAYVAEVFHDRPDLAAAVTPDYPFAGKRAVVSSDFFPALRRPNVTLVPHGVESATRTGLVDRLGREHAAEAVVLCTGFEVTEYLSSFELRGRGGRSLSEAWNGEPHAFLGTMVPGFPNFFMLYGPNTNGGLIVTNLERQAKFVVAELKRLRRLGVPSVEVTPEATARYNDWLRGRMAGAAFLDTNNYYKAPSGRVVTQWPDNATQYGVRLAATRMFAKWREPAGDTLAAPPARTAQRSA